MRVIQNRWHRDFCLVTRRGASDDCTSVHIKVDMLRGEIEWSNDSGSVSCRCRRRQAGTARRAVYLEDERGTLGTPRATPPSHSDEWLKWEP